MLRELLLGLALVAVPLAGCVQSGEPIELSGDPAPTSAGNACETNDTTSANESPAPGDEADPGNAPERSRSSGNATSEANASDGPAWDPRANVTVTDDGRLEVEVPVHVALVGFPESTAQ